MAALGQHATDKQKTKAQTQANTLRRKVTSWIEVQHLYIPGLSAIRSHDAEYQSPDQTADDAAHDIKLYLPSSIPSRVPCDNRLRQIEWELRMAQATDGLADLRDALRMRSYLYIDKDRFQRGQRQNTRARGIISRAELKINAAASKYRAARKALQGLSRVGQWEHTFPILLVTDIRSLTDAEANAPRGTRPDRPSEGRRTISWIWTRLGEVEQADELVQDGKCQYHL